MIDKINSSFTPLKPVQQAAGTGAVDVSRSFGSLLSDAMNNISSQEKNLDQLNTAFVEGAPVDTHQLMINAQKLSLSLDLTVQVRNKVIEAYQDIMRMQI